MLYFCFIPRPPLLLRDEKEKEPPNNHITANERAAKALRNETKHCSSPLFSSGPEWISASFKGGRERAPCRDVCIHRSNIKGRGGGQIKYTRSAGVCSSVGRRRWSDDGLRFIYASGLSRRFPAKRYGAASSQFVFLTYDADNTYKEKFDGEELQYLSQRDRG